MESMMVRTQIQLTEEQVEKLKELSHLNRESMASLIRKAIDAFLVSGTKPKSALYKQAIPLIGKYSAKESDISARHDDYLDEDLGE